MAISLEYIFIFNSLIELQTSIGLILITYDFNYFKFREYWGYS